MVRGGDQPSPRDNLTLRQSQMHVAEMGDGGPTDLKHLKWGGHGTVGWQRDRPRVTRHARPTSARTGGLTVGDCLFRCAYGPWERGPEKVFTRLFDSNARVCQTSLLSLSFSHTLQLRTYSAPLNVASSAQPAQIPG